MTIKLGLVGTGTVGGGCLDILRNHREDFKRHLGVDMEVVRVCSRNPEQAEARGVLHLFTEDFNDIINDPEIDIVIELIGGTTAARDVVLGALRAGKNVVTANKALMATFGDEVMDLAREKNLEVGFEASVGGGIPIIQPLKHSLISNEITSVMGIVNGTTNYMLTRMVDDGLSYEDALAEAQAKGFAEADPTADVDGFDAAAKIAILASIAFNSRVKLNDVYTEGIRNITHARHGHRRRHGLRHQAAGAGASHARGHRCARASHHAAEGPSDGPRSTACSTQSTSRATPWARPCSSARAPARALPLAAVMGDVLEVARHMHARRPAGRRLHLHRQPAHRSHGEAQHRSTTSASPWPTAPAC